jgi:hypothetical protein
VCAWCAWLWKSPSHLRNPPKNLKLRCSYVVYIAHIQFPPCCAMLQSHANLPRLHHEDGVRYLYIAMECQSNISAPAPTPLSYSSRSTCHIVNIQGTEWKLLNKGPGNYWSAIIKIVRALIFRPAFIHSFGREPCKWRCSLEG